jgi:hypothetical protein
MILVVVLAILTLFAIIGIAFVLYSDAMGLASRANKESENLDNNNAFTYDVNPERALSLFLSQFIYGTNDRNSVLRGHDLMRNLYGGYRIDPSPPLATTPTTQTPSDMTTSGSTTPFPGLTTPFSGTGRLHSPSGGYPAGTLFAGLDDYLIPNYQAFSPVTLPDGAWRDPEQYNATGATYPAGTSALSSQGGYNAPYTYPDMNNLFLGAIRASDGAILVRSFHHDEGLFGSLDPVTNAANWSSTAANIKYLIMRPHPSFHPNFPKIPERGGDVKNVAFSPGVVDPTTGLVPTGSTNDSIWMDIGAPIITAPDGTQYKMLVAPFIIDLDGLVNVNAAGNVRAKDASGNFVHASNMGFGTWEINPQLVLDAVDSSGKQEYQYLSLTRLLTPTNAGRYGADQRPGSGGPAPPGYTPHYYSEVDYDAVLGFVSTGPAPYSGSLVNATLTFPAATSPFPTYPTGYENGGIELTDHPSIYNPFKPTGDDSRWQARDLEKLYRWSDTGNSALNSGLMLQLPVSLQTDLVNAPRRRMQVTTDSTDLICAGITPYITAAAATTGNAAAYAPPSPTSFIPQGAAISSPGMGATTPGFEFATYSTSSGPTRGTQQYNYGPYQNPSLNTIVSAIKRINLNRSLTPYPTYDLTQRHDSTMAFQNQYNQATQDRQQFADDIYRTLLVVTGTPYPLVAATPTDAELAPMRYLAQIAANIVDYIDEDNINTVFNFYGTKDGLPAANLGDDVSVSTTTTYPANTEALRYWVVGTEMPRLLLSEALAEASDSSAGAAPGLTGNVKLWVELFNPVNQASTTVTLRPEDAANVPLYVPASGLGATPFAPYKIVVTSPTVPGTNNSVSGMAQTPPGANPFGAADVLTNMPKVATLDSDFLPNECVFPTQTPSTTPAQVGTGATGATPYFLLGPSADAAATWMNDALAATDNVTVTGTPFLRIGTTPATGFSYIPGPTGTGWTAGATNDERTLGVTVLLRRLADPQLPFQGSPLLPLFNPHVTIDYMEKLPVRSPTTDTGAAYASRGKIQPFAGATILTGGTNIRTNLDTTNSQVRDQSSTADSSVANPPLYHTFGKVNDNAPTSYTWLVHLDRQVVSPMELLHVSGYSPYLLTLQFINVNSTGTLQQFAHYAPWLDQDLIAPPAAQTASHRLYRLFEFLDANSRPLWTSIGNRIPGKININTIFETPGKRTSPTTYNEVWRALCDSNPNNFFNRDATNTYNATTPFNTVPDAIFANLLSSRCTNAFGVPQIADKPFMGIASGLVASGDVQYSGGLGIGNTILRPLSATSATTYPGGTTQLLLEDPNITATTHPYQRYQLLTKIFNNVTNRSNVFAIWLTVGFFQVEDTTTTPPKLGVEIRAAEGLNIRHRMFAIVDRTNVLLYLSKIPATGLGATTTFGATTYSPVDGTGTATDLISWFAAGGTASKWTLATTGAVAPSIGTAAAPGPLLSAGTVLVAEPFSANEEAAVVTQDTATPPLLHVTFQRTHAAGSAIAIRGNPGPWPTSPITITTSQDTVPPTYDVRNDPNVVLMWSIIN